MTKKKEELLFVAECTDAERKPRQVYVYKSGRAFILRSGGHSKVCHPSVHTDEDIKREIGLVYEVTVVGVKYPWELNKPSG